MIPIPAAATDRPRASRRKWLDVGALLLLLAVAGVGGYLLAERQGLRQLQQESLHRLDLLATAIDSEV
ncbi:MAG: hypothetical protein RKP46_09935, partial [Candidatus Accumulibacter sp.]|nr:hypothetical protein [Accumulibacter sp.]